MRRAMVISIAIGFLLAACGEAPEAGPGAGGDGVGALSAEQKAAYDACLERNMAVAMAWEAIEQGCLDEAMGRDDPLTAP